MLKISFRLIVDVVLAIAVFILPWWLSFLLIICLAYFFPLFFEFLIAGGILWLLYYSATTLTMYVPLVILALMFVAIEFSKKYLIFYANE